jgi:uncharacterized phage protein (TIGR02220 family)
VYAKLFRDVLTSSLNETEPVEVRGVFFLMMAAADKDGNVLGSDQTIARIINVPLGQFRSCIEALMKPDPQSRCDLHEGRRVVPMERGLGYLLPAYPKYSGIRTDEERREYFKLKKQESRARLAAAEEVTAGNGVTHAIPETTKRHESARPILHYLIEKSGTRFRETETNLGFIGERLAEDGVDADGVRKMIDRQVAKWKGTDMADYLRPETLFNKTKFDGYYAAREMPIETGPKKPTRQGLAPGYAPGVTP